MRSVAIDLDGVLGDTRGLWRAFLEDAARRFRSIAELDTDRLPHDRAEAAVALDRWAAAGIGDWRAALERFAEDHAPVHLRPNAEASNHLRALSSAGWRVGAFTDAPEQLARVAVAHFGVARRLETLEAGAGSLERTLERFGKDVTLVARSLAELATITTRGA
jgi:phosphoglycolate phosphatase-like HAD superfamily hydrolase